MLGMLSGCLNQAVAQKTLTLPARGIHSNVGRGLIVPAKKWLPTRQQCLYSTKDLPASPIQIREIAFQPKINNQWVPGLEAAIVTFTLDMSIGLGAPRKWSRSFAKNLGTTATRVFSGKINLPKIIWSTQPGWHFRIPLAKSFLANPTLGQSLVFDFATTAVSTTMTGHWLLVQGIQDVGIGGFQGGRAGPKSSLCHFLKTPIWWEAFGQIYVGSQWSWSVGHLQPNQPGFLMLGDAGWGSKWGGLTLPIDLKPFGAPSCFWALRPIVSFPFLVNTGGGAVVAGLRIPNDPRLGNAKLYTQAAYAFPKANALGWIFLPSLVWRIGTFEDHHAAAIGSVNYTPPTQNKLAVGMRGDPAPWCRITY